MTVRLAAGSGTPSRITPGPGVPVTVAVAVAVIVAVFVGVAVLVAVPVAVLVNVAVAVYVAVGVGVPTGVSPNSSAPISGVVALLVSPSISVVTPMAAPAFRNGDMVGE